jgi:hypothetical protein
MTETRAVVANEDHALEALAAELTAAVYPVALRHLAGDKWLDLELDLWRALTETIKKSGHLRHAAGKPARKSEIRRPSSEMGYYTGPIH